MSEWLPRGMIVDNKKGENEDQNTPFDPVGLLGWRLSFWLVLILPRFAEPFAPFANEAARSAPPLFLRLRGWLVLLSCYDCPGACPAQEAASRMGWDGNTGKVASRQIDLEQRLVIGTVSVYVGASQSLCRTPCQLSRRWSLARV